MEFLDLDDERSWWVDMVETQKGARVKYLVYSLEDSTDPTDQKPSWIFKQSIPKYPVEFWSEILAFHIGQELGVEVPEALPAIFRGTCGALIKFMLFNPGSPARFGGGQVDTESLLHGGDLILSRFSSYERLKGEQHSVQLIHSIFESDFNFGDILDRFNAQLFRQFLFDAIIGNQDRHQDNWGVIETVVQPKEGSADREVRFWIAPAFDNGSSLGREFDEEQIAALLSTPSKITKYIRRGKAHVRWLSGGDLSGGIPDQLTHEELILRYLRAYRFAIPVATKILAVNSDYLESAVRFVCVGSRQQTEVGISNAREEFIVKLIRERLQRLRGLLHSVESE